MISIILIVLGIVVLFILNKKRIEGMAIQSISPPYSLIENYLKASKKWNDVMTKGQWKDITFINNSCAVKDG